MHGVAYDAVNDEIIVPVALSGAVLVFAGGAQGDERRSGSFRVSRPSSFDRRR